jgi:chromosome segregation ATPase
VIARAVDTQRRELVEEREGGAATRRDLAALRSGLADLRSGLADLSREHDALARERFLWEERYHALNGEMALLKEEHARLQDGTRQEIQRLYGEEGKLRAAVEDQTAHLGRTYAEIERLNGMIREMEATRDWRVHQWMGRRKA